MHKCSIKKNLARPASSSSSLAWTSQARCTSAPNSSGIRARRLAVPPPPARRIAAPSPLLVPDAAHPLVQGVQLAAPPPPARSRRLAAPPAPSRFLCSPLRLLLPLTPPPLVSSVTTAAARAAAAPLRAWCCAAAPLRACCSRAAAAAPLKAAAARGVVVSVPMDKERKEESRSSGRRSKQRSQGQSTVWSTRRQFFSKAPGKSRSKS